MVFAHAKLTAKMLGCCGHYLAAVRVFREVAKWIFTGPNLISVMLSKYESSFMIKVTVLFIVLKDFFCKNAQFVSL